MKHIVVPDSWQLTVKLRKYALDKGLSDAQVDDLEESFRIWEFKEGKTDIDRAWMRWVRTSIEWGKVVPAVVPTYSNTQSNLTEEERQQDIEKFHKQMERFKVVK